MANLVRRNEQQEVAVNAWEPLRLMRELMSLDPFAEILPTVNRFEGMTFAPRFDVRETQDAYVFKADLPGIEEKDLDVTLTGNRITISGNREAEQRQENETLYAYERSYGTFSRTFTLPEGADFDRCEAELRNGVLTLSVPKRPEHQPKKVSIKSIGEKVKAVLGGKDKGQA